MNIINLIDLNVFLSNKNIIHKESLINDHDIITFNNIKYFLISDLHLLVNEEGYCFYEFSVDRIGDIIDNIHFENLSNLKITYHIAGNIYTPEEINLFIIVSSLFHDFKIRITFLEKPNLNDNFTMISRYYILKHEDKKLLANSYVTTENNIYFDGMCIKKTNNYITFVQH